MYSGIDLHFAPARLRDEADEFFRRVHLRSWGAFEEDGVNIFNKMRKLSKVRIKLEGDKGFINDKWFNSPTTSTRYIKPLNGMDSDEFKRYRDENEMQAIFDHISSDEDCTPAPRISELKELRRKYGEFKLDDFMLIGFFCSITYEILVRNRFVDIKLTDTMFDQLNDFLMENFDFKSIDEMKAKLYHLLKLVENRKPVETRVMDFVGKEFIATDLITCVKIVNGRLVFGMSKNQIFNRRDKTLAGHRF